MKEYISIRNCTEHDLTNKECPDCNSRLHYNRYKDLYVVDPVNCWDDISISIDMFYCKQCDNLFIKDKY